MSKTFCQVKLKDLSYKLFYLEDRYFPLLGILTYFHQQKRVNWFNKLSYRNEYISGLRYFFELAISTLSATLQAGYFIDQVDRDRCANRNQSRGIQLIHAKRLTHHPNTRYTLLVMDSCHGLVSSFAIGHKQYQDIVRDHLGTGTAEQLLDVGEGKRGVTVSDSIMGEGGAQDTFPYCILSRRNAIPAQAYTVKLAKRRHYKTLYWEFTRFSKILEYSAITVEI